MVLVVQCFDHRRTWNCGKPQTMRDKTHLFACPNLLIFVFMGTIFSETKPLTCNNNLNILTLDLGVFWIPSLRNHNCGLSDTEHGSEIFDLNNFKIGSEEKILAINFRSSCGKFHLPYMIILQVTLRFKPSFEVSMASIWYRPNLFVTPLPP